MALLVVRAVTAVDAEQLARAALAEAYRHPLRSATRRAAAHLWISCTVPPVKTIDAAKRAVASFGAAEVQADALALLDQLLTIPAEQEQPA